MATGPTLHLINAWLNHTFRAATYTAPTGVYAKAHVGDPGATGTANPSAQTTRYQVTFAAAAGGAIAMNNNPEIILTATETITHVSFWDAPTGGNCLWTAAALTPKSGALGDAVRLASLNLAITGLAS